MPQPTVLILMGILLSVAYYHTAKTPTANNLENENSPWRQPRLNVDQCVTLHNEIVRLGWEGSGRDPGDFEPRHYSFKDEKGLQKVLNPDLASFLERAYVTPDDLYFHYWVYGLVVRRAKEFLWGRLLKSGDIFVQLYAAASLDSDYLGIIFDQRFNTAIFCMNSDDIHDIEHGRTPWYPLEKILDALLDTIKSGKI